jgi:hypothetical protein
MPEADRLRPQLERIQTNEIGGPSASGERQMTKGLGRAD